MALDRAFVPDTMAASVHSSTATAALSATNTSIIFPLGDENVRCGLHEIQKADVGRKFLHKDRRPLDPPPTCLLSLWRVHNAGTTDECQEPFDSYDDVRAEGWVCHVEMYEPVAAQEQTSSATQASALKQRPLQQSDVLMNSGQLCPDVPSLPAKAGPIGTESLGRNMTSELRGSTFTQALKLELDGRKCLVFAFTDLSSTTEGTFVLRYRCFNIFAATTVADQRPIVAECVGGSFTVYSTRTFPGLGESTPLTKALSSVGMHPNKRESVRKIGPKRKSSDG